MKMKPNRSQDRQAIVRRILRIRLEQSHLIKIRRLLLKHSSTPNQMYEDRLVLDYPNPALDLQRRLNFDTQFVVDYQLHNLYRKCLIPSLTKEEDLDKAAYRSFFKGERNNIRTNRRLKNLDPYDVEVNTFVMRVQNCIAHILGQPDLNKIVGFSRFSSGATADLKLREADLQQKYAFASPSVTHSALKYCRFLYKSNSATSGLTPLSEKLVGGNRVLTVPKSNSTNRTIAAEPTLNMFFQLGVGMHIRRRLRRFGINLNDQTINQELARLGSIDGKLATIDLENASNSVSYEAVKLLLPPYWFDLLNDLRSQAGSVLGRTHRYRMFSSMGNGYTFELESLIFYAICKVACNKGATISVYGDDIIVPTADVENVIRWLAFFGFSTNRDKSFTDGFFRESCGKHYHSGSDVTPFFVRSIPKGLNVYLLFNNIARFATRDGYFDNRFRELLEYVLSLVPEDSRIFGPDGLGDGHLLEVKHITSEVPWNWNRKVCALTFKSVTLVSDKKLARQEGALCASLLGHTKENTMSLIHDTLRKRYVLADIVAQH